jgi:hypothetical protein
MYGRAAWSVLGVMGYEIDILNPVDYEGWDDLLASGPEYSFFHSCAWAKVLWETYHYRPLYFTVHEKGTLVGLMAMMEVRSALTGLRGVSLPFTDYCAPVAADGFDIRELLEFVTDYAHQHRWKSVEIRGGHYPSQSTTRSFYIHRLNLASDPERLFSGFKPAKQRNIRKAIREGVEVEICRSLEAVQEYYRLHCLTRKKHGLPPQPWRFFEKIYEHIISKNQGFIALARRADINVAGSVFFNLKKECLYKFGASDHTYQDLRGSDLVMWEAIKRYAQNGYSSLCMGRTAPENAGLRRFKAGWGTQEQVIDYYKYDLRRKAFVTDGRSLSGSGRRVFSVMPLCVLKVVGSLLYRHAG